MNPYPGDIITYLKMCQIEGASLQRGMTFRLKPNYSVVLMSMHPRAPYGDLVQDEGRTLIYEGHDIPKTKRIANPKQYDQPMATPLGKLTQNALFYTAAKGFQNNEHLAEHVRVYEKLRNGIWAYNGVFQLIDAWLEHSNSRKVFKFCLKLVSDQDPEQKRTITIDHTRMIPSSVKAEVWKRDNGRCVVCGSNTNLHFDHIIPFSKGGSSLVSENIQLMCTKHDLAKRDKIE
jgi:5-methylcytosine-specific restriction endonuclease McrA